MLWYVYILESLKDHNLYVGLTNNLKNRIKQHNNRKVFSTKNRVPFKVIFCEVHCNKYDAAKREQFLKSGWGKNWIRKTLNNYFRESKSKKLGG
jgi:putative endonuclease